MGCWNSTCALSGLTTWDERVRVGLVFLTTGAETQSNSSVCQHDGRLKMVTPPLWGEDDSYGRVVVEDSPWAQEALAYMKRFLPEADSLLDVQEALQEDAVSTSDGAFLYYTMVREDVWKRMVKQGSEDEQVKCADFRAHFKKEKSLNVGWHGRSSEELAQLALLGMFGFEMPVTLREAVYSRRGSNLSLEEDVRVTTEVFAVQVLMSKLRLEWTLGVGAGKQIDNHRDRKRWFESMVDLCEDLLEQGRKEEEAEED